MVTRRGEFPATIRVECPSCGQLGPVALRSAEGSTAEYEDFCEGEPRGGSPCGTALVVGYGYANRGSSRVLKNRVCGRVGGSWGVYWAKFCAGRRPAEG